ncbi:MAG: amino acid adenylation domain-containing protein [Pelatocladus maniniholoensis HA4357-MV3]|jgi:amino acid adenylation domain-containing protein|uniref:Amino acid adenylation domain-containing protein n=1 Tax=Pelatocladus maniniholoensis HA4357-MV3 TaxID=1117104 RepID=A0A9E3HC45_9NOST|nr:amino acid adenylation domain-containing protein [Pelatocladus maniniholoensis HA4357-MV3]
MNLNELLTELSKRNVKVWAEADNLRVRAPKEALTLDLRNSIAEHKVDLLRLLCESNFSMHDDALPAVLPVLDERYQPFPLTDIQYAYWVGRSGEFELSNVATHAYLELECNGLDLERLNCAWQQLIERHEMLRTVVLPDGTQKILTDVPLYQISVLDLLGEDPESIRFKTEEIRQQMSHQMLPTDKWPLFDIRVAHLSETFFRLYLSFDALVTDLGSLHLLFQEWSQLYQNPELVLPQLELSFRDYVLAEERLVGTQLYQRSQAYWFNRLDSLPPAPDLPLAKNPNSLKQPRFHRRTFWLNTEYWQKLKKYATDANLTPSGVLLAAYAEILTTWSKSPQFTIDLTLFNRLPLHPQVNQIVGDFTSVILLQIDNSTVNESFVSRAVRLQKQLWQDLDHRYVNGVHILRELARKKRNSPKAMMPVVFTSALGVGSLNSNSPGLSQFGEIVYGISQTPQVWLDHQVIKQDGGLVFNWDAVEDLFPPGMLDDMFNAYCNFLVQLATQEPVWHSMTRQLVPPEQLSQRVAINATKAPLSGEMLHTLFTRQVERCGDRCAIISPQHTLTYSELNKLAHQVAHQLRQLGASPNRLIAVVMEKGWEQVVAVLGILISGAAYLPIDPDLPIERQKYLLKQGEIQIVLTQSCVNVKLEWSSDIHRINIDTEKLTDHSPSTLESVQNPKDLAYVIYTSGSTGLPKGVMIDHQAAVNTILDINQYFQIGEQDCILALSALNFDLSVYDIFGILAAGGTIVIPKATATRDPAHWIDLMTHYQVTLWNSVPALMQMLVEYIKLHPDKVPSSLRLTLLSGDWLPLNLPTQIKTLWPKAQVVSLGGATEASIWSIFYPIENISPEWKSIPYGRSLTNQSFYVFNELLEPCPIWVSGQLYIGGVGLAKGYWRDQEKTQNSFITHPRTKERLYKTGDLGRYLPDGNIEFLGREDFQVKVNGYRIELGEIEVALKQHPLITDAIVTAIEQGKEQKQLVAYVISNLERKSAHLQKESAVLPVEAIEFQKLEGVITDPVERIEFKLRQPGLQSLDQNHLTVELIRPEFNQTLTQTYLKRQSYRQMLEEPVPFEQFGLFLSCLMQMKVNHIPLPKYRYPSAGSLYPVQTYLLIKPNRVEKLEGGIYYYHPAEHRLVLIKAVTNISEIEDSLYSGSNKSIFEQAAFALFLIGQMDAINPMYGGWARDFCLLEAGYMSQLLMDTAPDYEVGLCPIGHLNFEKLRNLSGLSSSKHIVLHSFIGGRIILEQTKQWLRSTASPTDESALTSEKLSIYLQQKLPSYMVPCIYVFLDKLPLTPNGKIDRKSLPIPDAASLELPAAFVAPYTATQKTIVVICADVLALEKIGIHDNLIMLGVDSLQATQIVARLRKIFPVELPLRQLWESPTIADLAEYIDIALWATSDQQNRSDFNNSEREEGEI